MSPALPLLDYEQAAQLLNITPRHLRELVYRREVPHAKVGRLIRFRLADLEAYIETRLVRPAGKAS